MSLIRTTILGFATLALLACGGGGGGDDDGASSGSPSGHGGASSGGSSGAGSSGASSSSGGGSSGASSSSGGGGPIPTGACVIKSDIRESTTWSPAACPDGYLVKFETQVTGTGVDLVIEPGTVVKLDGGTLIVEQGAALVAEGTPDAKVRFTSLQGASGSWRGLRITSDNVKNRIAHAVIEHAGSSDQTRAALTVGPNGSQSGRVAISDTEIVGNARLGLALLGDAKLTSLERVTIRDNALGAAHVRAPLVPQLKGTGNTFEGVTFVEAHSLGKIAQDAVWPSVAPGVYRIVGQGGNGGDVLQVQSHLEIEAGAIIEMAPGSGILVAGGTAGLKAVGTAGAKIVFRGVDGAGWQGITFGETTWPENRLEHVEVQNALGAPSWGYYGTGSAAVRKAGVLLGYNFATPVSVAVKDFVVAGPNSAPADVAVKSGTTLVQAGTVSGTGANGALAIESF